MSHGGYTTAELYAITYGIRDITKSIEKYFYLIINRIIDTQRELNNKH